MFKTGDRVCVAKGELDVRLGKQYYERMGAVGPRFNHEVCTVEASDRYQTKLRGYRHKVDTMYLYLVEE